MGCIVRPCEAVYEAASACPGRQGYQQQHQAHGPPHRVHLLCASPERLPQGLLVLRPKWVDLRALHYAAEV